MLLSTHISDNIAQRANSVSNMSELAQIAKNIYHLEACRAELARLLMNIRQALPVSQPLLPSLIRRGPDSMPKHAIPTADHRY